MGYMRHHAIVVTSWNRSMLEAAHAAALAAGNLTSEIIRSRVNGEDSFFVAPDGSKEGWEESDQGDEARAAFIQWLDEHRYEDGSTALKWVEVQFGDDNWETKIVNDSEAKRRIASEREPATEGGS